MKKFLTWTFVCVVALATMALVALDLLQHTTALERDAVIAQVRARSRNTPLPPESRDATGAHSPTSRAPSAISQRECEAQAAQFEALNEAIRKLPPDYKALDAAAKKQAREVFDAIHKLNDNRFDAAEFSESIGERLAAYVDSRAGQINEARTLLATFDPDCGFLQESKIPYGSFAGAALDDERAFALYRGDFDTVIDNMAAGVPLAYEGYGYGFPYEIAPRDVSVIFRALESGVVRSETWDRLLSAMRTFRHRNFMVYYARHYPHVPIGATVQETSLIKRGIRAFIREVQEPTLNLDTARLVPVLEELAGLTGEPYYKVKPELDRIVAQHDLTPHDRHSYSNESSARASIVNIINTVFHRNAVVQMQIDIVSISIALERTRQQRGGYPESLESAADFLGATMPLNPIDGTPYRYEVAGDGFLLGFELDHTVVLSVLDQKRNALWVESSKGELRIVGGAQWQHGGLSNPTWSNSK